jgi:hypothetical protein
VPFGIECSRRRVIGSWLVVQTLTLMGLCSWPMRRDAERLSLGKCFVGQFGLAFAHLILRGASRCSLTIQPCSRAKVLNQSRNRRPPTNFPLRCRRKATMNDHWSRGTRTWEVFVQRYQLYCLTSRGELVEALQFSACDDLSAVQQVRHSPGTSGCEVWQEDRLVARLRRPRATRPNRAVETISQAAHGHSGDPMLPAELSSRL